MKVQSETFIDKSTWGEGPWKDEPDKVQWQDETGLPCLVVRAELTGSLCGYVGVPESNPFFKKKYDDVDVEVHGGLTYADLCHGHICHVVEEGEDDNIWWLGFDCSHFRDFCPAMDARMVEMYRKMGETRHPVLSEGTYRDLAYVKQEIERLARQLVL